VRWCQSRSLSAICSRDRCELLSRRSAPPCSLASAISWPPPWVVFDLGNGRRRHSLFSRPFAIENSPLAFGNLRGVYSHRNSRHLSRFYRETLRAMIHLSSPAPRHGPITTPSTHPNRFLARTSTCFSAPASALRSWADSFCGALKIVLGRGTLRTISREMVQQP